MKGWKLRTIAGLALVTAPLAFAIAQEASEPGHTTGSTGPPLVPSGFLLLFLPPLIVWIVGLYWMISGLRRWWETDAPPDGWMWRLGSGLGCAAVSSVVWLSAQGRSKPTGVQHWDSDLTGGILGGAAFALLMLGSALILSALHRSWPHSSTRP